MKNILTLLFVFLFTAQGIAQINRLQTEEDYYELIDILYPKT